MLNAIVFEEINASSGDECYSKYNCFISKGDFEKSIENIFAPMNLVLHSDQEQEFIGFMYVKPHQAFFEGLDKDKTYTVAIIKMSTKEISDFQLNEIRINGTNYKNIQNEFKNYFGNENSTVSYKGSSFSFMILMNLAPAYELRLNSYGINKKGILGDLSDHLYSDLDYDFGFEKLEARYSIRGMDQLELKDTAFFVDGANYFPDKISHYFPFVSNPEHKELREMKKNRYFYFFNLPASVDVKKIFEVKMRIQYKESKVTVGWDTYLNYQNKEIDVVYDYSEYLIVAGDFFNYDHMDSIQEDKWNIDKKDYKYRVVIGGQGFNNAGTILYWFKQNQGTAKNYFPYQGEINGVIINTIPTAGKILLIKCSNSLDENVEYKVYDKGFDYVEIPEDPGNGFDPVRKSLLDVILDFILKYWFVIIPGFIIIIFMILGGRKGKKKTKVVYVQKSNNRRKKRK